MSDTMFKLSFIQHNCYFTLLASEIKRSHQMRSSFINICIVLAVVVGCGPAYCLSGSLGRMRQAAVLEVEESNDDVVPIVDFCQTSADCSRDTPHCAADGLCTSVSKVIGIWQYPLQRP